MWGGGYEKIQNFREGGFESFLIFKGGAMKKLRILGGFDFFLIFHIFYIFLRMKTSRPLGGGRALNFFVIFWEGL